MIEEKELHYFPVKIMEYTDIGHSPEWVKEFTEWARGFPAGQDNFPEGVITSKPTLHKERMHDCVDRIMLFFEDCLDQYVEKFKLDCESLDISLSWFNHAPARTGWGHPLHRHPMAYLSAVYYITDGAPTIFDDPCIPRTYNVLDIWEDDKMKMDGWNLGINEKYEANPGKLILFPSWLKHFSGRQLEDFDRWTISFNAFPSGKINQGPHGMPQLNLEVL